MKRFWRVVALAAALASVGARVEAQWREVRSGGTTYYQVGDDRLARRLLAEQQRMPPLPGIPQSFSAGVPLRIFLAPNAAVFDSLTGGSAPEWGAGVALPDSNLIVMPVGQPERGAFGDWPQTLRHEIAHVVLHEYLKGERIRAFVPRWFDEGYATWAAGKLDAEGAWVLRLAFVTRKAPPLDSLALDWPALESDARVAYLLSASAVQYLATLSGERGLSVLLARWRETGSLDNALGTTFGLTMARFERDWRKDVTRRYGWTAVLTNSVLLWGTIAVLLLFLYLRRRRRDRAKLAQLVATEIPDDPAYWVESEDSDAVDHHEHS